MKKTLNFLLLIIVVAGLSNCAPSDTVVQTAITKTFEANPTFTNQPNYTPELAVTISLTSTGLYTSTPSHTSTPSATAMPEGWLYYDDFEGEEKTYISLEDNPNLVSKGTTTIDDDHVYYVDAQTQTTLLFSELLDTTEPLEDYAVQFDMMLSNQPNLSLDNSSWFSVDLRSNRRNEGTSFEYYTLSWGFWLHKARDGSLRNSQINLGYHGSDQEPIEIGIKQGDHYFFYENFWYHIRVEIKENEFRWYFNDRYNEALFFRYADDDRRIASGWPSFSFGPDTRVTFYFDNILVDALE